MVDHGSGIALLLKFYDGDVEKAANLVSNWRPHECDSDTTMKIKEKIL